MPASAHQHGDHTPEHGGAQVIDFTARASQRKQAAGTGVPGSIVQDGGMDIGPEERAVAQAWENAMARQGLSLTDPTVQAAAAGVADMLEQLITGAQRLREGDAGLGIPADPGNGVDAVSAQLVRDLLQDLRRVPAGLEAIRQGEAREL